MRYGGTSVRTWPTRWRRSFSTGAQLCSVINTIGHLFMSAAVWPTTFPGLCRLVQPIESHDSPRSCSLALVYLSPDSLRETYGSGTLYYPYRGTDSSRTPRELCSRAKRMPVPRGSEWVVPVAAFEVRACFPSTTWSRRTARLHRDFKSLKKAS